MRFLRFILIFSIAASCTFTLKAQSVNSAYKAYIEQYKSVAVDQMIRYHIPASITLAQGLLESGAGRGELAQKSNNHFGIKCGSNWSGPTVSHNDDYRGECFRKYRNPMESYEDHSMFLSSKPRYASLFRLDENDYRGWAYGLKSAGYATNPSYAQSLIKLIELYDLSQFDNYVLYGNLAGENANFGYHTIMANNNNYYLIARQGDTFKKIADETGVSERKLIRNNELFKDYVLQEGDIIYMEKKKTKAERAFKSRPHTVKSGESLYDIAQAYGIQLKSLYKMNNLDENYSPKVGDILRVR